MNKTTVKINAKINLSLNVTGVSNNGFHYLDMVTASVDIADAVTILWRNDGKITCRINFGKGVRPFEIAEEKNTAVKAAALIKRGFDTPGVDIIIDKHIPAEAGLGGSSADAAGVIAAMADMRGIDKNSRELLAIALQCGSDVVSQLTGGYKRVTGTGEKVQKLESGRILNLVIAKGAGGVSTKECYGLYDRLDKPVAAADNDRLIDGIMTGDYKIIRDNMNNSLFAAAVKINPGIAGTLSRIRETGAVAAGMSGSGSACFGIYRDWEEAARAAEKLSGLEYVIAAKTTD